MRAPRVALSGSFVTKPFAFFTEGTPSIGTFDRLSFHLPYVSRDVIRAFRRVTEGEYLGVALRTEKEEEDGEGKKKKKKKKRERRKTRGATNCKI